MVKVMMYGCNGYMGHVICNLIKDMENVTVAAGIDPCSGDQKDFPVFASLDECNVDVDVIIDFSAAVAVDGVLDYAAAKKIPLVECTTGLSEEQLAHLEAASKQTAILRSANMSLGVNTLLEMVKTAAKILGEAGFDIDIVEKHHRRKLDAPSGTALALQILSMKQQMASITMYLTEAREECSAHRMRLVFLPFVVEQS